MLLSAWTYLAAMTVTAPDADRISASAGMRWQTVPGWCSDAANVLTAGVNELNRRNEIMGIANEQIRLNTGILTDKEAATQLPTSIARHPRASCLSGCQFI